MAQYYRFRPDCFHIQFNYAHTASIISEDNSTLEVWGTFRTDGDLAAILWDTKDPFKHKYCTYPSNSDYSKTVLKFKLAVSGHCTPFNDVNNPIALAIRDNYGSSRFASMGFLSSTSAGTDSFYVSGDDMSTSKPWIKWHSLTMTNDDDPTIVYRENVDYRLDYRRGTIYVAEGGALIAGQNITVQYRYSDFSEYVIDFGNLYDTEHPETSTKIDTTKIDNLLIPLIHPSYVVNGETILGKGQDYHLRMYDMQTINGFLSDERQDMPSHGFRMCEGYDDTYNLNPRRLCRENRKLGYDSILNLYVGASHFYEKFGTEGAKYIDHHDMTLDRDKGLTIAYRKWHESLLRNLKINGTNELVVSFSMENLQMPYEWKQLMHDGEPGGTGWVPATAFYSPTNMDCRKWVEIVCRELMALSVQYNLTPILQWGEPWWWWQEFVPENVQIPFEGRPPCFYDAETKKKFKAEHGYDMPIWKTTDIFVSDENRIVLEWLRDQLVDYSDFMRAIAKSYPNGQYCVLYFPPSIIDIERVPYAIQICNTPYDAWNKGQLDFIQVEDYDWVINSNHHHTEVYDWAENTLGYKPENQHYFSGFAWEEYPGTIEYQWTLVERAALEARGRGFREVFFWAGTQVRRDSYTITNKTAGTLTNWAIVNKPDK